MKWSDGKYSVWNADVGGGAIRLSVSWSSAGHIVRVAGKELADKPASAVEARQLAVKAARELVERCRKELDRELEETVGDPATA